jgi:hypothetical protein
MRILALLVLACLGLGPLPAWAQTVKVGAVVPLTGRYGAGGAQIRAGYEIAVEHLSAVGGVAVAGKKMPIELILLIIFGGIFIAIVLLLPGGLVQAVERARRLFVSQPDRM